MVAELVDHGWLQRGADRRVSIGASMWELVCRAAPVGELRQAALPYMTELHARVGQHVNLAVRQGRDVLFVDRLSAPGAVRIVVNRASRLPLSVSAPGLVLLANAPSQLQDEVLAGPLPALGPRSVTDPWALRALLSEIRRAGNAICSGWLDPVSASVAVPLSSGGRVIAALSLVVPNEDPAKGVPVLQHAAAQISRALAQAGVSDVVEPKPGTSNDLVGARNWRPMGERPAGALPSQRLRDSMKGR